MSSQIKGIRLISGEELIGEVELVSTLSTTSSSGGAASTVWEPAINEFIVNKPQVLVAGPPGPNGAPQLGMTDFALLSKDKKITIQYSGVLFMYVPIDQILQEYQRRTGKILTPGTPGLVV